MAQTSYYSRRRARDPDWRERQIQEAIERDRRRREEDPQTYLASHRDACRRYRERLRQDPERLAAVRAKRADQERERRRGLSDEERAAASRAAVERKRRASVTDICPPTDGLTLTELHERIGGDPRTLAHVLREEVRSGRVLKAAGRYALNGKLPDDVKRALLAIGLADDRR